MNFTQSPPCFGNKSSINESKTAKNGNFWSISGKFFKGGRKTKHEYEQQQSILSIFSLAVIRLQFQPLIIYNFIPELYKTSH